MNPLRTSVVCKNKNRSGFGLSDSRVSKTDVIDAPKFLFTLLQGNSDLV